MRVRALLACLTLASFATAQTTQPATTQAANDDLTVGQPRIGGAARRYYELHDEFVRRSKQGDLQLLFIGDSITRGWSRAPDVWREHYEPLHTASYGVVGDKIENLLWRIEHGELDGASPRVIVLLIGTNNVDHSNAESVVAGIRHLVGVLHRKCPDAKVLQLGIFPRKDAAAMHTIAEVNKLLAAGQESFVTYLDISQAFYDADGSLRNELFADDVHPDAAGYAVWEKAMRPTLERLMKP